MGGIRMNDYRKLSLLILPETITDVFSNEK